jgi:hypothetical protein
MLLRMIPSWIVIVLVGLTQTQAAGVQSANPVSPAPTYRALLDRYCTTCHSEKLHTAGVILSNLDLANVGEGAALLERVMRKVKAGEMPPAGMPRPDKTTMDSFSTWLETSLDGAAKAKPNPGRPPAHRLNRAEYANVIRDLLAIDVDATDVSSLLPPDDSGYGFDNNGDVLSLSPVLVDRYLSAAEKISHLAIGDPAAKPSVKTYSVSRDLIQEDRMSDDLPFGSRGGIAIHHYFPLDGEYVIQVRMQRTAKDDTILDLGLRRQIDVRLDGARLKLLTFGGDATPRSEILQRTADSNLEVRFPAKAGTRVVGVSFLKETTKPEGVIRQFTGVAGNRGKAFFEGVGTVTILGPYNSKGAGETSSRGKIFVCRPTGSKDEDVCAKKILSTLTRHAYRRPVTDRDIQPLLTLYNGVRSKSGFEAGIGMALRAIMVGPEFLFRIERDPANVPPGTAYRINPFELASRLSFFLWSSIPDDQLLNLAEQGKLNDPVVLKQQVQRMLADSRSKALVDNFAGQWLYLRNMRSVLPDPFEFPDFNDNLREAFHQETELFFESMLREDRSVLDLLNADYTFLNERLARHYQIPNVFGNQFRRVQVSDEARRGLLGQASILTVTSYSTRTSPTLRGKWLLENLLGTPPPPPPANVPSLKDRGDDGKILSVRQQMELHRANPACAGCHARMDPLGFALENFDGIGRWRTTSGAANTPIDSSGVLPDGTKFQGPAELRKILLSHREQFVTNMTEKLLTYGLGRGAEYYDAPAIRAIVREAAPSDYTWSSVILGIVKSIPFQMRRSPEL